MAPQDGIPQRVLIIGGGVFGLSTALSLARNAIFKSSTITLIDRSEFPSRDGASVDTSRLVRADYADAAYSRLALVARDQWRGKYGADGRYFESGLLLTSASEHRGYVDQALQNVSTLEALERGQGLTPAGVTELRTVETVRAMTRTGGCSGDQGYINHGSGWVDAEMVMRYMKAEAEATKRVKFVTASVTRLLFTEAKDKVIGASTLDGKRLEADLVILAAGAWSGALLDLRGLLTASGQILAYIELSAEEQKWLSTCPTQINMSTGMFMVPPPPGAASTNEAAEQSSRHNFLKVARHGYGYANLVEVAHPEMHESSNKITVSLPHTNTSHKWAAQTVPDEALEACRSAMSEFIPPNNKLRPCDAPESLSTIATRDFAFARLCHYSDSPTGNFLIDYHPSYADSLFVAAGGSGHGFKFAPVIGDSIVQCILRDCPADFKEKWAWPSKDQSDKAWKESVEAGGPGWDIDGSRGDRRGMILKEELNRVQDGMAQPA